MGIYKNDYRKEEDELLWELHEIRNQLMNEYKGKSIEKINREAMETYKKWMKDRKKVSAVV